MGIQGLLPFLKKIHEPVNIAQFKGCTVAIDAYCWLHKGAFSCAEKLAMKEDTDQYVYYCLKYINYILSKDIKPIMVFDGCHLESKAGVEKTRRERRELHRKRAAQFLREGKRNEAKECLQKCVDITPQMALKLIQACRDKGVDCIVAPYEADAQLAYLNLSGIAQVIITEDSDLLLFGCDKIIFKMDFFGNGTLIQQSRLNEVLSVESGFYTFEKFRHMCILSGCDYLPSLPGIGLATANKVFKLARQGDIRLLLKKLPTYMKKNITVTDEYVEGFIRADNTFLYQLVFDPLNRLLKPLNPYTPELQGVELKYAGHHIARRMAYQIALGNIDIHTHEAMAYFDPDSFVPKTRIKAQQRYQLSIWDKDYAVKTGSPCKEIQPSSLTLTDSADDDSIIARGRFAPKSKVIKLSHQSDNQQQHVLKVTEVLDVYGNTNLASPKKSAKKRIFDVLDDCKREEEGIKRRRSLKDLDDSGDAPCNYNDENDESSPVKYKFSPVKRAKFKYDASNIGEETFKEGRSVPHRKGENSEDTTETCNKPKSRNIFAIDKSSPSPMNPAKVKYDASNIGEETFREESGPHPKDKTASCKKRPARNIFAVEETAKNNQNVNISTGVKSKYFSSSSPKTDVADKPKGNENSLDVAQEICTSKKGTPKPMSLRAMFENLKEKKAAEGDKSLNSDSDSHRSSKESNEVERCSSGGGKQTCKRTPSAFSWSKFKFNSSSGSSSNKSTKLQSSPLPVNNSTRDSFSELLAKDSPSTSTKCSSSASSRYFLSSSPSSASTSSKRQTEILTVDATTSKEAHERSATTPLQRVESSAVDSPDPDVKEIESQSYDSFLKSISSLNEDASKYSNSSEGQESGYEGESPFPENDNRKLTKVVNVNVVNEDNDENPVVSSQDSVIDLTQEASQTSSASGISRSSNSSGQSKCRVSGLSKRKGKKTQAAKSDPGQKSIKDLFSKFAFKKETELKPTAISTSYSIDSLDESSDDDLSETPISKSFEISNPAVVRRKLML